MTTLGGTKPHHSTWQYKESHRCCCHGPSWAAGYGRFWNIHRTHPIWVHASHIGERTTARDPVQHKRWTYPSYRAVNTEHQQGWTRWWCTTPSKHLVKVISKGGASILKVHKCCTPVNKAMSEILNCYLFLGGEGWLGFPDLWSGKNPWWNWYLTHVANLGEVRRAQWATSTLLTSSLVPLASFQIF